MTYSDEVTLTLRVLFVRIKLLPSKKKYGKYRSVSARRAEKLRARAEKKKSAAAEKKRKKAERKEKEDKKTAAEVLENIKLITGLVNVVVNRFFRHLRVRVARVRVIIGTPDAASTAIAYGMAKQVAAYLYALLEKSKHIKGLRHSDFLIDTDFTSDTTTADIKISFSLRLWHIFDIAIHALIKLIKRKFAQMKKEADETPVTNKTKNKNI